MCMPYLRQVSGRTRVHSTLIGGSSSSWQHERVSSARVSGSESHSESHSQESSSSAPASVSSQTLAVRLRLLSELGGRLPN